jgi:hypothetical protein
MEKKMKQIHVPTTLHCYNLEPGDATSYRFGMVLPDKETSKAFSGLGDGQSYALVYIDMTGNGWTYVGKWDLTSYPLGKIPMFVMHGAMSRLPQVDKYTVMAIWLALQVLVKDPNDIEGACKNMLNAADYAAKMSQELDDLADEEDDQEDDNE